LVDDKALKAMMQDSCDAARAKRVAGRGGSSVDQVADGVRKFQMGSDFYDVKTSTRKVRAVKTVY
jgi:hypothetical protein